ncbi:MAG TPA: PIN domain-containing protein [Thermomicrobiales bacterium]|nr:PIN domain-containing protein [Thermomicrobiales bacterium]
MANWAIQLVVSQHILDEVTRVWTKPYWRARFSQVQVDRALALLREEADVTPITVQTSGIATHPEDDPVLATALSAEVDYPATGDKRLQDIASYQGITILTPRVS